MEPGPIERAATAPGTRYAVWRALAILWDGRDPVDALNDAKLVSAIVEERCNAVMSRDPIA